MKAGSPGADSTWAGSTSAAGAGSTSRSGSGISSTSERSRPSRPCIALLGAGGRMGRAVADAVLRSPAAELCAAVERPGHPELGRDIGLLAGLGRATGICLGDHLDATLAGCDVLVDFSSPASLAAAAPRAAALGIPICSGTTGLGAVEQLALDRAAQQVAVVQAANMSTGVTLLLHLVAEAAAALGPGYDLEIVEIHHRNKRDAPSGTALRLAQALATARGIDLENGLRSGRGPESGPRGDGELGVLAVRGGDVVGDHTVYLLGDGERLELGHRATSRSAFAAGALRAALWLATGRQAGRYDMADVLGLRR